MARGKFAKSESERFKDDVSDIEVMDMISPIAMTMMEILEEASLIQSREAIA